MRRSAVFLVVLSLVLVACRAAASEITVAVEKQGDFPVTVETDLGPVTIATRPGRVVSLSATHTEILYAVGAGDQIAATDQTSNYPAAAAATAKLDSFNFDLEAVAALDPDLVILAFDFGGEAEALAALGIPFLLLGPAENLDSALSQHLVVGRATGHESAAADLVAALEAEADGVVARAGPAGAVTVFHEVDETLYSATSDSFIGDLYARLGFVNIADAVGAAGPFPQLSAEFIVAQNPDIIFLADAAFGVSVESVAARPGWGTISAVVNGNVIALDGDMAGRWGPRTVELMSSMLAAVG